MILSQRNHHPTIFHGQVLHQLAMLYRDRQQWTQAGTCFRRLLKAGPGRCWSPGRRFGRPNFDSTKRGREFEGIQKINQKFAWILDKMGGTEVLFLRCTHFYGYFPGLGWPRYMMIYDCESRIISIYDVYFVSSCRASHGQPGQTYAIHTCSTFVLGSVWVFVRHGLRKMLLGHRLQQEKAHVACFCCCYFLALFSMSRPWIFHPPSSTAFIHCFSSQADPTNREIAKELQVCLDRSAASEDVIEYRSHGYNDERCHISDPLINGPWIGVSNYWAVI